MYLAIYSSDEEKEAKRRNNGREKVCVFVCRRVEFYVDEKLKQNVRRTNVKFKKEDEKKREYHVRTVIIFLLHHF